MTPGLLPVFASIWVLDQALQTSGQGRWKALRPGWIDQPDAQHVEYSQRLPSGEMKRYLALVERHWSTQIA